MSAVAALRSDVVPTDPVEAHGCPSLLGVRRSVRSAVGRRRDLQGSERQARPPARLADERPARPGGEGPTTAAAASAVTAEERVLRRAPAVAVGRPPEAIPRVVGAVEFHGLRAAVMTAMQGMPMSTSYIGWRHTASRRRVEADFSAVAAWLAELQRDTAGASAPLDLDGGVATGLRHRYEGDEHCSPISAISPRPTPGFAGARFRAPPSTATSGSRTCSSTTAASRASSTGSGARSPASRSRDLVRFALMYALYLDRRTRPGRRVAGHAGLRAATLGRRPGVRDRRPRLVPRRLPALPAGRTGQAGSVAGELARRGTGRDRRGRRVHRRSRLSPAAISSCFDESHRSSRHERTRHDVAAPSIDHRRTSSSTRRGRSASWPR